MPLEAGEARRQRADHRVPGAVVRDLDVEPADLRLARAPCGAARRLGQDLAAEADGEDRHPVVDHRRQEVLLEAQPRMAVLLVDVHRTAEGEDGVVVGDLARRRRAALAELPLVQLDPAVAHLVGEDARPGVGLMGDGQRPHDGILAEG